MTTSKHIKLHCFLDMACDSLVSLKQNKGNATAEEMGVKGKACQRYVYHVWAY